MKKQSREAVGVFIMSILITLLVCPVLYAAEEILPTPEKILAKNIEAMGGKEVLKKIYNRKIVTNVKYIPVNIDEKSTEYQERPDKSYAFSETNKGITRYGSNGKIAWTIDPNHRAHLSEGNELSMRLFYAKFDRPDETYESMTTEGIEQINGKDCYKVVKITDKGTEKVVYHDKKSFMIVKNIDYFKGPTQGINKAETYYEDYKEINGILFPFKIVTFINGQKNEEKTYEKIELNIEMPEGIFDIPEEVKAIIKKSETEPDVSH